MAKRKTKKAEKSKKLTNEELKDVQDIINTLQMSQLEVGRLESSKHSMLHNIALLNDKLTLMQSELKKQYGTANVDIQTGEIKYPENNGKTN